MNVDELISEISEIFNNISAEGKEKGRNPSFEQVQFKKTASTLHSRV